MNSLVIGRNGLLGKAVSRALVASGEVYSPQIFFDWTDSVRLREQFSTVLNSFSNFSKGNQWQIYWCAGAGFVGASTETLETETNSLRMFLDELHKLLDNVDPKTGSLFVASSAGGLYAGNQQIICDELTHPQPISEYGRQKLVQEELVTDFVRVSHLPTLIGRISNLFGPGQRISKPQGFISQLCNSSIRHQPISIYVPLHTSRDYLYADDAGKMIVHVMKCISSDFDEHSHAPLIKIFCSEKSISLLQVISEFRRVAKKPVKYSSSIDLRTSNQSFDLNLKSIYKFGDAEFQRTDLAVGIKQVYQHLMNEFMLGNS